MEEEEASELRTKDCQQIVCLAVAVAVVYACWDWLSVLAVAVVYACWDWLSVLAAHE